jgi:hypothetical protein
MRIRFFLAAVLAIPIVFAAILIWTLTGSAESAYRPSSSYAGHLAALRHQALERRDKPSTSDSERDGKSGSSAHESTRRPGHGLRRVQSV